MRIVELYLKLEQARWQGQKKFKKQEANFAKAWDKLSERKQLEFPHFISSLTEVFCLLTKERRCQNANQENQPFLSEPDKEKV